jgi:hypothetical protein
VSNLTPSRQHGTGDDRAYCSTSAAANAVGSVASKLKQQQLVDGHKCVRLSSMLLLLLAAGLVSTVAYRSKHSG